MSRSGPKMGIDFDHYGLQNRVWFSREPRERINVFVLSTPNEQGQDLENRAAHPNENSEEYPPPPPPGGGGHAPS